MNNYSGERNEEGERHGKGKQNLNNDSFYDGGWQEDLKHGYGELYLSDGSYYKGNWVANQPEGKGVYLCSKGYKFDGIFEQGKAEGDNNILKIEDMILKGSCEMGKMNGEGILQINCDIYRGVFVNNFYEGKGTIQFANGDRYKGNFHKSTMHGSGKYKYQDNTLYSGEFSFNRKEGKGELKADGGVYTGTWKEDKKHWKVTFEKSGSAPIVKYYYLDKECVEGKLNLKNYSYSGLIADGQPFGEGRYQCSEYVYIGEIMFSKKSGYGNLKHLAKNFEYTGSFLDDKFDGKGELIIEGDGVYKGYFKDDKLHGLKDGVYVSEGGKIKYRGTWNYGKYLKGELVKKGVYFRGQFKNNTPHGKGMLKISNEYQYTGYVEGGIPSGEGIMTFSNSDKIISGIFKQGKPNGLCELKMKLHKYSGYMLAGSFSNSDVLIEYPNGGHYSGKVSNNYLRHGFGNMVYKDNSRYEGYWEDDKYHGRGKYWDQKGKLSTISDWQRGQKTNVKKLIIPGVGTWHGGIDEKKPSGNGKMIFLQNYPLFSEYNGPWKNDGPHGKNGIMSFKNGKLGNIEFNRSMKYDGDWLDGKMHGFGYLYNGPTPIYEGNWVEGLKHGKGIETGSMDLEGLSTKFRYNGIFEEGKFNGKGLLTVGLMAEEGVWVKGKKHGKIKNLKEGRIIKNSYYFMDQLCEETQSLKRYKDNISEQQNLLQEYDGQVGPSDIRQGKGILKFYNQDGLDKDKGQISKIYKGEFFLDKMHGQGKLIHYVFKKIGYRRKERIQKNNLSSKLKVTKVKRKSTELNQKQTKNIANEQTGGILGVFFSDKFKVQENPSTIKSQKKENYSQKSQSIIELDDSINSIPSILQLNNSELSIDYNTLGESDTENKDLSVAEKIKRKKKMTSVYTYSKEILYIITGTWSEGKISGRGKIEIPTQSSIEKYHSLLKNLNSNQDADNYEFETKVIYDGDFQGDKMKGKGKFIHEEDVYIGEFDKNSFHGKGTMKYSNGDIYRGKWFRGVRSGEGELKKFEGKIFKGIWKQDQMIQGEVTNRKIGIKFKGGLKDFSYHGLGKLVKTSKGFQDVYEGEFMLGKYKGEGELKTSNGDHFNGHFLNGKPNGRGKMIYSDGSSYEGDWSDGKRNGKGKMIYKDKSTYEGSWLNGLRNQEGKYVLSGKYTYKGSFLKDNFYGKGCLTFPGGIQYEGQFDNNLPVDFASLNLREENQIKSGNKASIYKLGSVQFDSNLNLVSGEIVFKNGDKFIGEFDNQMFSGDSTYFWNDEEGSVFNGIFVDGIPHGHGKLTFLKVDRSGFEGNYKHGVLKQDDLEIENEFDPADDIIEDVEDDFVRDFVLPTMKNLQDDFKVIFSNQSTAIEDIRSVLSIESAYKNKYIDSIDDYDSYREFCDALEIENLLKYGNNLIVKAIEDFSLQELLKDAIKTGSRSQRYFLIEIIMDLNFGYLIFFDEVHQVAFTPFRRSMIRSVNKRTYKATKINLIRKLKENILLAAETLDPSESGYLIFDEIILILLQTGVLTLNEVFSIVKKLVFVYEDLLIKERNIYKKNKKKIKTLFKNYARRRTVLAKILLQTALQVYDIGILIDNPDKFSMYYPDSSYRDFKKEYNQNFRDIIHVLQSLYEDYLAFNITTILGRSFDDYLNQNTDYNSVCLYFTYVMVLIDKYQNEPQEYECKERDKIKFSRKIHSLSQLFKEAKSKCKNSIFNFGFHMKELLKQFDLSKLFKKVGNPLNLLTSISMFKSLTYELVPSFIINYRSQNKYVGRLDAQFISLLKDPFSRFQLNSQGSTTQKYINWLILNDPDKKSCFSDFIDKSSLLTFDISDTVDYTLGHKKIPQVIKLYNCFSKHLSGIDNKDKAIKITQRPLKIVKISEILRLSEIKSPYFEFDKNGRVPLPVQYNYENLYRLEKKELKFVQMIVELRLEYIVYPKFLMNNCSFFNLDIEKFETLRLYCMKNLYKDDISDIFKKTALHAIVISFTVNNEESHIDKMQELLPLFLKYFNFTKKDDEFSQDLVYLIAFTLARINFSETIQQELSNKTQIIEERIKNTFSFVNKFISGARNYIKLEDNYEINFISGKEFKSKKLARGLALNKSGVQISNILGRIAQTQANESAQSSKKVFNDQKKVIREMWGMLDLLLEPFTHIIRKAIDRVTISIKDVIVDKESLSSETKYDLGGLISKDIVKGMIREFCRTANLQNLGETQIMAKIINNQFVEKEISQILKYQLINDRNMQSSIIEELTDMFRQEAGAIEFFQMILNISSKKRQNSLSKLGKETALFQSTYVDSYVSFWETRHFMIEFGIGVAENNSVMGKDLYYDMEPKLQLMKEYLINIKEELSNQNSLTTRDLIFQQWKLQLLEEMCIGPYISNQKYMTGIEYLDIYDFKHINRIIPEEINHPKFQRDNSLLNFYLAILEGSDESILQKIRVQIKPQEIVDYIRIMMNKLVDNIKNDGGHSGDLFMNSKDQINDKKLSQQSKIKNHSSLNYAKVKDISSLSNVSQTNKIDENEEFDLNHSFLEVNVNTINLSSFKTILINLSEKNDNIFYQIIHNSYLLLFRILPNIDYFDQNLIKELFKGHGNEKLLVVFLDSLQIVEVSDMNNQSQVVIFPTTRYHQELTKEIRNTIMEEFDESNPTSLLNSMLLEFSNLKLILEANLGYRDFYGYFYFLISDEFQYYARVLQVAIGFLINLVVLSDNQSGGNKAKFKDWNQYLIWILTGVMIFISVFYLILNMVMKIPIYIILGTKKQNGKNKYEKLEIASNISFTLISYILHLLFSLGSIFFSPIFLTMHLIMLVSLSKFTLFIINALMQNLSQLIATLVFMSVLVYIGSFAIALRFSNDFDEQLVGDVSPCETFWSCFVYTLDYGLHLGGGIAEALEVQSMADLTNFYLKTTFDLLFFIIINVIMLNIIFGLIIDAFASLRDSDQVFSNFIINSRTIYQFKMYGLSE